MTQPRSVTCPACRAWIEDRGRNRRCPRCGEDLDAQPLPGLPRDLESPDALQEPAFAAETERNSDTAPLSEFVAAGAVIGGVAMLVAGAVLASGTVALAGVILIFGVTGFFALTRGSLGRALHHYRMTLWGSFPRRVSDDLNDRDETPR